MYFALSQLFRQYFQIPQIRSQSTFVICPLNVSLSVNCLSCHFVTVWVSESRFPSNHKCFTCMFGCQTELNLVQNTSNALSSANQLLYLTASLIKLRALFSSILLLLPLAVNCHSQLTSHRGDRGARTAIFSRFKPFQTILSCFKLF